MTIEILRREIQKTRDGIDQSDLGLALALKLELAAGREPDPTIFVLKQINDRIRALLDTAEEAVVKGEFYTAGELFNKTKSLVKCALLITASRAQEFGS